MNELHSHRSLANARGDALHRTMPNVTHSEYSGNIGFEQVRIPVKGPAIRPFPIPDEVGAGEHEASVISLDEVRQPVRARECSDEYEHGARRDTFDLVGVRAEHGDFFEVRVPVCFGNAGVRPYLDVRRLL